MAHPSSSHRDRDDDRATTRERTHRTSTQHHHHRTISSTTLLLVLSLILAVLAVMLSLPSRSGGVLTPTRSPVPTPGASTGAGPAGAHPDDDASHSFWGYLTPKRSHALVSRESAVAMREAEVARREAELLAYRPTGWAPGSCPMCGETVVEEYQDVAPSIALVSRPSPPAPPAATVTVYQEIVKEVVKEVEPTNPAWLQQRLEGILQREMKISDREKEVGTREEAAGKRESDATKREGWIMEQLQNLSPDHVEEEVVYDHDHPRHYYGEARRGSPKALGHGTVVVTETEIKYMTPGPAPTRVAARPTPETYVTSATGADSGKTREVFFEVPTDVMAMPQPTVTVVETVMQSKSRNQNRRKWLPTNW